MNNANEPAFPVGQPAHQHAGLTKREYFAAMAMQGMLLNTIKLTESDLEYNAKHAIKQADAILKEMEKKDE